MASCQDDPVPRLEYSEKLGRRRTDVPLEEKMPYNGSVGGEASPEPGSSSCFDQNARIHESPTIRLASSFGLLRNKACAPNSVSRTTDFIRSVIFLAECANLLWDQQFRRYRWIANSLSMKGQLVALDWLDSAIILRIGGRVGLLRAFLRLPITISQKSHYRIVKIEAEMNFQHHYSSKFHAIPPFFPYLKPIGHRPYSQSRS
jgi:hypothetical protein